MMAVASCIACEARVDEMRRSYSARDWDLLTSGEIVTSRADEVQPDRSVRSRLESSAIIAAPVDLVWSVVTDMEARSKFIPGVHAKVVRTDGHRLWVRERLHFLAWNINYQTIDELQPEQGLATWTLDRSMPHDVADTNGSWRVASLAPQMTLVQYRAWIDTGRPVPRFLADFFAKRALPKVVGGLRTEVQRRALAQGQTGSGSESASSDLEEPRVR